MSRNEIYDRDEKLEQALVAVENIEPDFEKALLDFAAAETDYDVAWAKEFLSAAGAVEVRKQTATINTKALLTARNNAKAVVQFLRTKLKDRQDAVSARQSLLTASVKTNQRF